MSASARAGQPVQGSRAFDDSELDALFFFGREREREVIVANLLASRLTVLYGESGVGKSSLLARRRRARAARACDPAPWSRFTTRGRERVDDVLDRAWRGAAARRISILDQFEEYFLYHGDETARARCCTSCPSCCASSRVNVLSRCARTRSRSSTRSRRGSRRVREPGAARRISTAARRAARSSGRSSAGTS